MFKYKFKHKDNEDLYFDNELSKFPLLASEAWQINELIEEEAIVQRHRLSVILSLLRLTFVILGLIALVYYLRHTPQFFIFAAALGSYAVLVITLMLQSKSYRDKIYQHNFIVTLVEISLLFFLSFVVDKQFVFSFIFLSVILSAMCLPISRIVVVLAYAVMILGICWLGLKIPLIKLISGQSVDFSVTEAFLNTPNANWYVIVSLSLILLTLIINQLAIWSFKNDVKARFRHKQMRQVLSFNRAIIEHLKSGVIVVSGNGKILSINRRTIDLLDIKSSKMIAELSVLSPELNRRFNHWLGSDILEQAPYLHSPDAEEVFVSFSSFGEQRQKNIIMITLESVNETMEQTQHAKLSALGRLTAGVAHEIRNPLAAINSATQLLSEATEDPVHQKLSQVILKNVKRTNQIITDILGLFRDSKSKRELLPVATSLKQIVDDFLESENNLSVDIRIKPLTEEPLYCYFSKGQFEQILCNLFNNSVKYANAENLIITLIFGLSRRRQSVYIDIIDNGEGVDNAERAQIFEPFFTKGEGSGLGLYLARELCNANNAKITYLPLTEPKTDYGYKDRHLSGARFRIATKVYFSEKIKRSLPGKRDGLSR